MTSVRFAGELPLWLGLILSLIAGLLSWRYYHRESFDLPRRLKWLLPLLRSLAILLGIMILTGPVLHHRTIIGELGRITIIVDSSRSMSLQDRHMSSGRKLLIAEQLGWLNAGHVDATLLNLADEILKARQQLAQTSSAFVSTQGSPDAAPSDPGDVATGSGGGTVPAGTDDTVSSGTDSTVSSGADDTVPSGTVGTVPAGGDDTAASARGRTAADVRDALKQFQQQVSAAFNERLNELQESSQDQDGLRSEFGAALEAALQAVDGDQNELRLRLAAVDRSAVAMEAALRQKFEESVSKLVSSGDESVLAALAVFDETPRWRRTELALMNSRQPVLEKLRQQHDVRILDLAGQQNANSLQNSEQSNSAPGTLVDVSKLLGNTDLSHSLTAAGTAASIPANQQESGSGSDSTPALGSTAVAANRAAVVLLTDGQHNSGASPVHAARLLGSQGIQYVGVAVGEAQPSLDLAVLNVEYPQSVFRKDLVRGTLVMRDRLPVGHPFVAQILSGDEVLWQQQLITQNSPERRVEFEFSVDQLVEKMGTQMPADIQRHALPLHLEAVISPLPEETETANNQLSMRLSVIVQNHRILLLDGRSRWETRYLRNMFERDQQWFVNTVITGPGTDQLTLPRGADPGQFPASRDQLFQYDCVVFGEVAVELFHPEELQWLREFVESRGGGIVFLDGQRGQLRKLHPDDLASLLPIEWREPSAAGQPAAPSAAQPAAPTAGRPVALRLTDAGAVRPEMRLETDADRNRRFWSTLPAPHFIVAVRPLPGAEVLAEVTMPGPAAEPLPAMVTRKFGAGRVLYMAFDETWRWRYKVADTWHQRIWNQLVRSVMPRPFAVSDEYLSIDSGPVSYQSGQKVDVRIQLRGPDGQPASGATADALFWKDGRVVSTVVLKADPDVPGTYLGQSAALDDGDYEVSVQAAGFSQSALTARSSFVVLPSATGELQQTSMNEDLLRDMAVAAGGISLREEQIGRLPDLLSPLSNGRVVESDTLIWQSYWWFTTIVVLLTVEWILRKRSGLL